MSHHRAGGRGSQAAPDPTPAVTVPETVRAPPGYCPKCGVHVGRAVRAHAKDCNGTGAVKFEFTVRPEAVGPLRQWWRERNEFMMDRD